MTFKEFEFSRLFRVLNGNRSWTIVTNFHRVYTPSIIPYIKNGPICREIVEYQDILTGPCITAFLKMNRFEKKKKRKCAYIKHTRRFFLHAEGVCNAGAMFIFFFNELIFSPKLQTKRAAWTLDAHLTVYWWTLLCGKRCEVRDFCCQKKKERKKDARMDDDGSTTQSYKSFH